MGSSAGANSNYCVLFNINSWTNNWKSYQVSISCNGGPWLLIKNCEALPANPPETDSSVIFSALTGCTLTAKFEFGTSNANCLGGGSCVAIVPLSTLPVKMGPFRVSDNSGRPQLNWEAELEADVKTYRVERSMNGRAFNPIAFILPQTGSVKHFYSYTDNTINGVGAWYRIVAEEKDGQFYYSPIVFYRSNTDEEITTWPVPANDFLFFSMKNHAGYRYRVVSVSGHTQETGTVTATNRLNTNGYAPGTYVLYVFSETQNSKRVFRVAH